MLMRHALSALTRLQGICRLDAVETALQEVSCSMSLSRGWIRRRWKHSASLSQICGSLRFTPLGTYFVEVSSRLTVHGVVAEHCGTTLPAFWGRLPRSELLPVDIPTSNRRRGPPSGASFGNLEPG